MTLHVLHQLPFWVEGDLPVQDTAQVEAHLVQCPACREAADDLRRSQAWLKEAMASPFAEPDRTSLRRDVMEKLRQAGPGARLRPVGLRRTLLAACATLLLALLVFRPWAPVSHPPTRAIPAVASSAAPPPPTLPKSSAPAQVAEASRARPAQHPSPPGPEPSSASAPARIEFQTADPSIRIIWLAQATPTAEPVPLPQEKS